MYYKRVIIDEKGKRHTANSAGEFVVMDTLTKCGVCFDSEVSFPDLKGDKDLLRFDFCIHLNDKDILIEDFAEKMQNQPINIDLSVFIDSVV